MVAKSNRATLPKGNPAEETTCKNNSELCGESQELNRALGYARRGKPVFPCGINKQPLTKNGFHDATTDPQQIKEWWDKWPGASIGMPTGAITGVWVLDVDLYKPGAPEALDAILKDTGPLPETQTQRTGGDGLQFFFDYPGYKITSRNGKLGLGLDVKADGAYVILAGSGHPTGGRYKWLNDLPAVGAPEKLLELVKGAPQKDTHREKARNSKSSAYGLRALEAETEKVRQTTAGFRNETLNQAAFALGQLVAAGELSRPLAEQTLLDAAIDAGLPEREARKTIQSGLKSGEREPRQAPGKDAGSGSGAGAAAQEPDESPEVKKAWTYVRELMPRTPYPWEILPPEISESLRMLARACASTAAPLPGFACAMIGAAVGRTVAISVKAGWTEPLVFWFFDLLESGEGKTAKMRNLARVIMQVQREKQAEYNQKYEEWAAQPKKERGDPPARPRGYYFTSLTTEGVHAESEDHPTGGMIALLNEASTFIGGQNEYKGGKGTDREAWLSLHDGSDARIIRAAKSVLITGARVQIIGGIQPAVFRRIFGGDDKLYLYDGTVYRGLYTYNPPRHHPLTLEAWSDTDRESWERTLKAALDWADRQDEQHTIYLNSEAQDLFLQWRNALDREKSGLPAELRGFLPKAYGYSLRLAAVIDLMHQFNAGHPPRRLLDAEGMQRGIDAAMFYMGQAVDAMRLILGDELTRDPLKTRILEALQDRGQLTATEIYTDVFHRNRSADKIQEALNGLTKDGAIEQTTEPTTGRPRTIYKITPASKRSKSQETDPLNDLNDLNEPVSDFEKNDDEVEI